MTTQLVRDRIVTPAAGSYRIDPARSRIAFSTRHLFGLGAVHGTVDLEDGVIRVAERLEDSRTRAAISARSIATGHPARDRTVRSSRLLDTEAHPRVTFAADRLLTDAGCPRSLGNLVVRGHAGAVVVLIDEVEQSGPELRVRAHTRIDRYAFGATRSRGLIARHVDVLLDLVATQD